MEQIANSASSTLATACSAGAATITVTSGVSFPSTGNFRLRIDNELLLATARTGSVITVTRAVEGTLADSHADGAAVELVITVGGIQQVIADAIAAAVAGTIATNIASAVSASQVTILAATVPIAAESVSSNSVTANANYTMTEASVNGAVTLHKPTNLVRNHRHLYRIKNTSGAPVSVTPDVDDFRFGEFLEAIRAIEAGETMYIATVYNLADDVVDIISAEGGYT